MSLYFKMMRANGFWQDKGETMVHVIDSHVGKKIRYQRWKIGMTQSVLAERIGVKFQQVQKYETGANRISASRLWEAAKALEVPITFFFEDNPELLEQSAFKTQTTTIENTAQPEYEESVT
jgi:transcriptional regulator with XRE-family HTH domain